MRDKVKNAIQDMKKTKDWLNFKIKGKLLLQIYYDEEYCCYHVFDFTLNEQIKTGIYKNENDVLLLIDKLISDTI